MTAIQHNEEEMRAEQVPWFRTAEELMAYIGKLVEGKHDYGTRAYAMSLAATAALRYVGHTLGCTGFQASCADLDILRRTRSMECPFAIVSAERMCYPQYDLREELARLMTEWAPWARDFAARKLADFPVVAHPGVIQHWKKLASGCAP